MPDPEKGVQGGQRLLSMGIGALLALALLITLPMLFASTQPNRGGTAERSWAD